MRVEQLRLERYGFLRDRAFDFVGSSFSIISGANGVGKSSIRASFSDLLFGFPHSSPWAIGFEQHQLKLGAIISNSAGQKLNFDRLKARRVTLQTADGAPLDEAALQTFLAGVDRRDFETLYALDAKGLRDGGNEMLKAQSAVGQTLFAAAGGVAALFRVREALKVELESIGGTHRAREKPIWRAQNAYQAAISQTQESALRADEWGAAERAVATAKETLEALGAERAELEQNRGALERKLRVFPILAEIARLRELAAPVASAQELPIDIGERWRQVVAALNTATEAEALATSALARRQSERNALPANAGPLPANAEQIEHLHREIGAIRSLLDGEIKRERDVRQATERLGAHAVDLSGSVDSVERLASSVPSPIAFARVRALTTEHEGLKTRLAAAVRARDEAREALDQDKADLQELGDVQDRTDAVAALQAARGLAAHRETASADRRKAKAAAERAQTLFSRFDRWDGSADELVAKRFPDADTVRAAKVRIDALAASVDAARKEVEGLETDIEQARNDLEDHGAGGAVPPADAVRAARAERDGSWGGIRQDAVAGQLPTSSAMDQYEVSLRSADALVDRRLDGAELLARQKRIETDISRLEAALKSARVKLGDATKPAAEADQAWQNLWREAGIAGEPAAPELMLAWLQRKDKLVEAVEASRAADAEQKQSEAVVAADWGHLQRAASLVGAPIAADEDPVVAEQRVNLAIARATEGWTKAGQLHKAVSRRAKESKRADDEVAEAERLLTDWQTRWTAEMPAINLAPEATPDEATAILGIWDQFGKEASKRSEAQRLLKGIREDLEGHRKSVHTTLSALADTVADLKLTGEWHDWPPVLYQALQQARKLALGIEAASDKLAEAVETSKLAQENKRLAEEACLRLRAALRIPDDEDVVEAIARSDLKRQLADAIDTELGKLREAGEGMSEEALRGELATADRDAIRGAIDLNGATRRRLDADLEEAIRVREQALRQQEQLERREGYAAATQIARNEANQAGVLTQRWMRLTTALLLLDKAVESYRQANEGPLVARANEIFMAIAGHQPPDNFERLDVDYQKPSDPRLVGLRANGVAACRVEAMSEGTRDQLWLALRIAALELRAGDAEPMPFLADDLFASSDTVRAEAGIRYLAELARHTQVILFTHHDYVVDAARRIVPDVLVHELQRAA